MIRKTISNICASLLLLTALALGACSNDPDPGPGPAERVQPIGTYELDGTSYEILTGKYESTETTWFVLFSPLAPEAEQHTTYVMIGLAKELQGMQVDVRKFYHNDDYYFLYEDPVYYYSQFRALQDGTIFFKKNGSDNFTIRANVVLPDGKPFSIDFTGDLRPAASDESGE